MKSDDGGVCSIVYMADGDWSVGTHVQQGGLHHFSQLLDLLLTSTYITVGHIRLLLHLQ